jgi:hypothetical protein
MLNLIGIRRVDKKVKEIPIEYSMSHTKLQEIIQNKRKIKLQSLTDYEKRCYWEILDEESRLGDFRRIKFEDHLDEMIEPSYLTQLVYYMKTLGVYGKDFTLKYPHNK